MRAGHASLIRTIIGGAQIIDMMILVIDVTKGGAKIAPLAHQHRLGMCSRGPADQHPGPLKPPG